jgi:filamentous hemagglutinin family protein
MMQRRWHALLLATTAVVPLETAWAGPINNQPTGCTGSCNLSTQGTTTTQTTNSPRSISNWQTFDVGSGYTFNVVQPNAGSIALERVVGGNPSNILGTLTSNGIVFLVNPNGILFGKDSVVNVGGLLATTHDIKDSDFLSGNYKFSPSLTNNNPSASVVNQGMITAQSGGFAALVAPGVRNTGTITATLGTVGLAASGNGFTLDMYGDKLITLAVGDRIASQVIDVSTGNTLASYVSNEGKLKADGGRVVLTAAAAKTLVDSVINNSGNLEANSVGTKNGMIVLSAATAATKQTGDAVQKVSVSGKLKAKGKNDGETGGSIKITGENISLAGAKLNASGKAGGGTVMIGMDVPQVERYFAPVATGPNATTAATTTIDSASTIKASGQVKGSGVGNGGTISIWSDNATTMNGRLIATGGVESGQGGRAFIFGAQSLAVGASGLVNLSGANGGQDDKDRLIIASGNDLTIIADPSGLTGGASYVTVNALQNTLANNSVSINAGLGNIGFPGFTSRGSITVADNIAWSSFSSLKLQANQNITVNPGVTIANTSALSDSNPNFNQEVNLYAGQNGLGTGTVNFGEGAKIDMSRSWAGVNIEYNPQGGYSYSHPFDYTPFVSLNQNLGNQNFQSFLNAAMLVNTAADLQSIGQNSAIQSGNYTSLSGNYTVVQNIDLGSISNFVPIGTTAHPFTGNFNGNGGAFGDGITISNLKINASGTGPVGLFGVIGTQNFDCSGNCSFGTVSNVALTNVNITANNASAVGALAGVNNGSIWQSSVTGGTVSSTGSGAVGGMVGSNTGGIMNSLANVTVNGGSGSGDFRAYVGGLAGRNDGWIQTSLSLGAVTGGANASVGGLVGYNAGSLQDTYAIGAVTGGSNSYAGGLVGYLAGGDGNGGTITTSWASGLVTGGSERTGGLVGGAGLGSSITHSFWDTYSTGQQFAIGNGTNGGATAVTSDPSQAGAFNYAFNRSVYNGDGGLDFNNTWFMVDGLTRPFLQSEWSGTITNAHQLQLMAMDPTSGYYLGNNINLTPALTNRSDMWSTAGFAPIAGTNPVGFSDGKDSVFGSAPGFVGFLQGLGNTIDGLTIASSAPFVGLFGMIGQGGVVRDVNLTNVSIGVPGLGGQSVGAVAGVNFGTIDTVTVKNGNVGLSPGPVGFAGSGTSSYGGLAGVNAGTISASSVNNVAVSIGGGFGGGRFIGGLVGFSVGGTIIGSSVSGDAGSVSAGDQVLAGGLVGASDPGTSIVGSFASVTVTAGANSIVGGLVGGNSGIIAASYATGATTGGANSYVGGLAGANANFSDSGNPALIVTSYAGGAVNGGASSHVGGLVGDNGSQIL